MAKWDWQHWALASVSLVVQLGPDVATWAGSAGLPAVAVGAARIVGLGTLLLAILKDSPSQVKS